MPLCEWVNATGVVRICELSVDWNFKNASPSVHSLGSVSDIEKSACAECIVLYSRERKTANIWHVALKRVNPNRGLHSGEEKCTSL